MSFTLKICQWMCQKSHVSLRHSYYREYGAKLWTKSKNPFTSLCIKVDDQVRNRVRSFRWRVSRAGVGGTVSRYRQKVVGRWLIVCSGMVFGAVILGGVTRLTESGLSMVEWRLLKDMTLPRSQHGWEEEFERYKTFPEYQYLASQRVFTLSDFKFIYYMEWLHRMWGRAVGLVFLLPAIYFGHRGWISKQLKPHLVVYTALIGLQGFLGWYMVKSGLTDKPGPNDIPRVSAYRLAAHLGSAILLYTLFLWQGLSHLCPRRDLPSTSEFIRLGRLSHGVMTLVFLTALSGAFVAGLDAGLVYNSWPKMADQWIPDDLFTVEPIWRNMFENPTFAQFNHRHMAELTCLAVGWLWWTARSFPLLHPRVRLAVNCLAVMSLVQAALGITTLLTFVPMPVASAHQSGSLVLLSFAVWLSHQLRRLPK